MDADKEQFCKPVKISQVFSILSASQSGGFAAAENLRSSASICG
jgi:hypothetical protein